MRSPGSATNSRSGALPLPSARNQVRRGTHDRAEHQVAVAAARAAYLASACGDNMIRFFDLKTFQLVAELDNGVEVVVREQRVNTDPALDSLHPRDRVIVQWDETAPFLLSGPSPASDGNGVNA